MTLAGRAVATLRTEGPEAFARKCLNATVWSRLVLFELTTLEPVTEHAPHGITSGWIDAADVAALESSNPGIANAAREREARGDSCYGTAIDGRLQSVRWIARDRAIIDHFELALRLAPHQAYHYALWTHPDARRQGLVRIGTRALIGDLAAVGVRTVLRAIDPFNPGGLGSAKATGFAQVGMIHRVGLGRASFRFVRVAGGLESVGAETPRGQSLVAPRRDS